MLVSGLELFTEEVIRNRVTIVTGTKWQRSRFKTMYVGHMKGET